MTTAPQLLAELSARVEERERAEASLAEAQAQMQRATTAIATIQESLRKVAPDLFHGGGGLPARHSKPPKSAAAPAADPEPGSVSKLHYARSRGFDSSRMHQLIKEGRLAPPAVTSSGRIIPRLADEQIVETLVPWSKIAMAAKAALADVAPEAVPVAISPDPVVTAAPEPVVERGPELEPCETAACVSGPAAGETQSELRLAGEQQAEPATGAMTKDKAIQVLMAHHYTVREQPDGAFIVSGQRLRRSELVAKAEGIRERQARREGRAA
jgi:hypothetical protein